MVKPSVHFQIGTAIVVGLLSIVAGIFAGKQDIPKDPEWATHAAQAWAARLEVATTAISCQRWNSRYYQCDVSVNGTIYPLDCYSDSGCAIERK